MAYTEAELAQRMGEAHGRETGRVKDPKTATIRQRQLSPFGEPVEVDVPNPDPTYIITYEDGSEIRTTGERDPQGQATGSVNVVDWGTVKPPTAKGDVFETPGGLVRVSPGGKPELIYPTQPNRAPVNVGEGGGRLVDPTTGQVTANVPPTPGYIDQQAQAQAQQENQAAQQWANFFRQQQADAISQAVAQGTLSETQAANVWKRVSDMFVDWPKVVGQEARATEATRQTGAANAGRYGLDVAGEARQQGQSAVDDAKYLAEHTAVGTGYSGMPDLEGARQRTAAALYNRMPDYQALLAQQPALPYYGPDELAQTQSLAMPYLWAGGGAGQPVAQPPVYTYNPAPAPQPAYPPAADETDPRRNPWAQLMSGGY